MKVKFIVCGRRCEMKYNFQYCRADVGRNDAQRRKNAAK